MLTRNAKGSKMQIASRLSGETPEERQLRREAILKQGPIFASGLRFSFDDPKDEGEGTDKRKTSRCA